MWFKLIKINYPLLLERVHEELGRLQMAIVLNRLNDESMSVCSYMPTTWFSDVLKTNTRGFWISQNTLDALFFCSFLLFWKSPIHDVLKSQIMSPPLASKFSGFSVLQHNKWPTQDWHRKHESKTEFVFLLLRQWIYFSIFEHEMNLYIFVYIISSSDLKKS